MYEEQRDRQTLGYVGLLIREEWYQMEWTALHSGLRGEGCVKWSGGGGGDMGRRGKEKQLRFTLVLG